MCVYVCMYVRMHACMHDKLRKWIDHFNSVLNCSTEINELAVASLPDFTSHSVERAPHGVPSDDDLCACLSEREILTAIRQLKTGKAPDLDGISPEMLKLGGDEYAKIDEDLS